MTRRFFGRTFQIWALGFLMLPVLASAQDWASTVKFPASEKPVRLFNGKDFDGWEGNTGENGTPKYFTIKDGAIVARNESDNAPPVSNYLLTKKNYRNFRLIFEGKLAESPMHSGIAFWGKKCPRRGCRAARQSTLWPRNSISRRRRTVK